MAKLIIDNLTPEQAKTWASWYEGQGEQDAGIWFDINGVPTPYVDCFKKYIFAKNGDVTIFIES